MPEPLPFLHGLSPAHQRRLDWALRGMGASLMEALQRDRSPEADHLREAEADESPEHLARVIMERADPTSNKRFTPWLAREYAAGRLILEDLGTANETLALFQRYAPRLKAEQRDIQRYGSLAAAWEAVRGFAERDEVHSNKAQKALDRARAYEESRILRQDPDGFTVAVPLTGLAAKWWGKGTRWCTAAEKDNAFWNYHQQAPLIVIVIPELGAQGKFQLWVTEGDVLFMDAADNPVSEVFITEYWPRFEPIISFAVTQNVGAFEYVPAVLRSDEACRIAASQNGKALGYVPWALRTEELCGLAVARNGQALDCVPVDLRTEELCRIAVVQDGWALRYVPEKLRTEDLCKIAVAQNGEALHFVPWKLRTGEMCRIAVTQDGRALYCVPRKLRTEEMCGIAAGENGLALADVPVGLRSDEACRIAVSQNGRALEYMPKNLRTEELCRIAVAQNGWALCHVPRKLRTEELCRIAVAQNGAALSHVPDALRSEMQKFAKAPQRNWDLAILERWAEVQATEHTSRLLEGVHA